MGSSAVSFNQAAAQYLRSADMPLNMPGTANASQGVQVWAYVNGATLMTTTGQVLVFDTVNNGGPAITPDGKWTQLHSGHTNLAGTVAVVPNTWHHIAQHIHLNSDTDSPNIVAGTGTALPFTSVIYVNGIAVSANNDSNTTASGGFAVGAAVVSGEGTAFSGGVLDSLEVYSSTANQFDLFLDNKFIAGEIAAIPGGVLKMGDVNRDGSVNSQDIAAFKAGWTNEKKFVGGHNSIYVGDWETWGWGDLNTDGQVNLLDALLFNRALKANGAGSLDLALLANATSAVPEPATWLLAVLALGVALCRGRVMVDSNGVVAPNDSLAITTDCNSDTLP